MFPSGTPLVTELVIYGVVFAFALGAAGCLYDLARPAAVRAAKRLADRLRDESRMARPAMSAHVEIALKA